MDADNHGACNPKLYSSSLCRQQLLALQECAVGGAEDVLIDLTLGELSLEEREKGVSQFLHFLRKFSHMCTYCFVKFYPFNFCIPSLLREFWFRILSESSELGCLSELFPSL